MNSEEYKEANEFEKDIADLKRQMAEAIEDEKFLIKIDDGYITMDLKHKTLGTYDFAVDFSQASAVHDAFEIMCTADLLLSDYGYTEPKDAVEKAKKVRELMAENHLTEEDAIIEVGKEN